MPAKVAARGLFEIARQIDSTWITKAGLRASRSEIGGAVTGGGRYGCEEVRDGEVQGVGGCAVQVARRGREGRVGAGGVREVVWDRLHEEQEAAFK